MLEAAEPTAMPTGAPKRRLRAIHLWLGLPAALFVVLIGLTGTLLAFRESLERFLNPKLTHFECRGPMLPLNVLVANLQRAYPGQTVLQLYLPEATGGQLDAVLGAPGGHRMRLSVNPTTSEVLGDWGNGNHFVDWVLRLHRTLLLGSRGNSFVQFLSFVLVALALTGLLLSWRRRSFSLRAARSSRVFLLELHSFVGLYFAGLIALFSVTALQLVPKRIVNPYFPRFPEPAHSPDRPLLAPDQLLAAAQAAVPGAVPTWLDIVWQPGHGGTMVAFRGRHDHTWTGQTHLHLDPYTGRILDIESPPAQPFLVKLATFWTHGIHTATLFGWPSRVVGALTGLAMAFLALTGSFTWWRHRAR